MTVRFRVPEKQSDYRPRSQAELDHTATLSTAAHRGLKGGA